MGASSAPDGLCNRCGKNVEGTIYPNENWCSAECEPEQMRSVRKNFLEVFNQSVRLEDRVQQLEARNKLLEIERTKARASAFREVVRACVAIVREEKKGE
jgi:hypothetical protein